MVEFHYPSGSLPANPDEPIIENNLMWAWGYGEPQQDRIRGLETTIDYIFRYLDEHGPFIGIMGFSTGATIATIIASLLEKRKSIGNLPLHVSFHYQSFFLLRLQEGEHSQFPSQARHPPLEFVVSFAGLPLENPLYEHVYYPKIETPALHVIGTMDTMIDEAQCVRMLDSFTNSSLHRFFGTHYVPRTRESLDALADFFAHVFCDKNEEDDWEDLGF